jgi:gamma-glutamyl-gamma-aminobutyraldehyde dehydrogenase
MIQSGGSTGKPLLLELGGKSPQLVFADMRDSVEEIAAAVVGGAFRNAGQLCVARSRLLVERSLHDRLVDAVTAAADAIKWVDPLSGEPGIGPLASDSQYRRVRGYVERAHRQGAKLTTRVRPDPDQGCYVAPAVFTGVDPGSELARDEIFGPVLAVMSFDDDREAIALANASAFGLAATVWTSDFSRGLVAAQKIASGKVSVRSSTSGDCEGAGFSMGSEPWGHSGFGIEGGLAGLHAYTRMKMIELIA